MKELTDEQLEAARAILAKADAEKKEILKACAKELQAVLEKYGCAFSMTAQPFMQIVLRDQVDPKEQAIYGGFTNSPAS
jgi:hypothetical protein